MIKALLMPLFFVCFSYLGKIQSKEETMGTIVNSLSAKLAGSENFLPFPPNDSIFYKGNKLLEKVMSIHDLEVDGKVTRSYLTKGYYYIDLEEKKYILFKTLNDTSKKAEPLERKKSGLDFNFNYWKGEKIDCKDTIINNKKMQLLRFVSKDVKYVGAVITIILSPEKATFPSLNPAFEKGNYRVVKLIFDQGKEKGGIMREIKYMTSIPPKYAEFLKKMD